MRPYSNPAGWYAAHADTSEWPGASPVAGRMLEPPPAQQARRAIPHMPRADALTQYLRAVGRRRLLTPEEEHVLAVEVVQSRAAVEVLERSGADEDTLNQARARASRAKARMVEANLRLVVSIAKRFAYGRLPLPDLIQEGNLGLMMAVDRFDPAFGTRFSTYGTWWIAQAIRRAFHNGANMIRIPVHVRDDLSRIDYAASELFVELGRGANSAELADATGLPIERIDRARGAGQIGATSLDRPRNDRPDVALIDTIPDCETPSPFDATQLRERKDLVRHLFGRLSPRQAQVLMSRFDEDRTLAEIGHELGISRERVRQIEIEALRRMRQLV